MIAPETWAARDVALSAALTRFLADAQHAPGVIARIEAPGVPAWTGAVGLKQIEPALPISPDDTFRIASNTKTFTAAAVLRLWERGALALTDLVHEYLPNELVSRLNVIDGVSYGDRITIEHLLQHSSGIREPENEPYVELVMADPAKRWTPLEQIEFAIAQGPPSNAPGEAVHYSNTGYIVLAVVIEQVTGVGLAESFRSLLRFDDLRLDAVHLETLEPVPASAGARVRHYLRSVDVSDIDASMDLFGGGGLVSNVRDLVGFWRALFAGNVFDSAATLERMLVTRPRADRDGEAGLGLFRESRDGRPFWSHTGFWGSGVLHDRETGLTLAVATNEVWSSLGQGAAERLQTALVTAFDHSKLSGR